MRREILLSVVFLAACRPESPLPRASAPAMARPYRPPADGRLSERQVQAYVAARRSRSQPDRPETAPGADALDERRGGDEYLWVRQKILESEMRLDERDADRREIEIARKTAASLRAAASSSTDPATKDSLSRQAVDLDRRAADTERTLRKGLPAEDPVNDGLVARYRRQIEAAERGRP
jgi:hypothetical protein